MALGEREARRDLVDYHHTLVRGRVGVALGVDRTQAVQLSASSCELPMQFGHLVLQPALHGHQFGAALADGERVAYEKWQEHLRPHRRDARPSSPARNRKRK